ncbi:hypothetical protein [Domibacillus tundrae]|uniref:hypothetical protein n=1 Tax=Domibacillus tundrae TaxID=1587527 RepID=UPI0006985434
MTIKKAVIPTAGLGTRFLPATKAQPKEMLPVVDEAPSMIAVMGRYVLKPSIFDILETLDPGAGNEIQLTDALRKQCAASQIHAVCLDGQRYGIGDKFGYLRVSIEMALARPEMRGQVLNYLEGLREKIAVK